MSKIEEFLKAPIYNGKIENEVSKPTNYQCFPGAWYYKALSAKDYWLGIEAIVTLPEFLPDDDRIQVINDPIINGQKLSRHMDTPSIYVGGSSDFETDIGLGWFRGTLDGTVPQEKFTFRPFYRYIFLDEQGNEKNIYAGPGIKETEFYYFPGDKVKINVFSPKNDYLQCRIELLEATTTPKYKNIRARLGKAPQTYCTEEFNSPGNGHHPAEYKRVNAIDQYSNEGKPSQFTKAMVLESTWSNCYLYRKINDCLYKVPFDNSRYIQMKCPNEESFIINATDEYETVVIKPKQN